MEDISKQQSELQTLVISESEFSKKGLEIDISIQNDNGKCY